MTTKKKTSKKKSGPIASAASAKRAALRLPASVRTFVEKAPSTDDLYDQIEARRREEHHDLVAPREAAKFVGESLHIVLAFLVCIDAPAKIVALTRHARGLGYDLAKRLGPKD